MIKDVVILKTPEKNETRRAREERAQGERVR